MKAARGDIWWVDFEPARGGEVRKTRPAVVVSNADACRVQNRLQVVPLSGNAGRIFPWEAAVRLDGRQSKAMADQIKTVAIERLKTLAGRVTAQELSAVERAIRVQLAL